MKKIVLFASGNGSNVENIIQYFKNNDTISVVGIFTNNPHAKVIERAKNHEITSFIFDKNQLNEGQVLEEINKLQPDLIVLAGFLLKFPEHIIAHYPNKIINIHPALLPNYGGKGMYGMNVHRAVLENKETIGEIVDLRGQIEPKGAFYNRSYYQATPYPQLFGLDFEPNLSILDLLFCMGPESLQVLMHSKKNH